MEKKITDFLQELEKLSIQYGIWIEKDAKGVTTLVDDNINTIATDLTFDGDKQLYTAKLADDGSTLMHLG